MSPTNCATSLARAVAADRRRAGAGERAADPDLDRLFAPLEAAGHRRPRRRNARARQAKSSARRRRCRRTCGATSPARQSRAGRVEDKGYSLALHYRNAPEDEEQLARAIDDRPRRISREATEVLSGKFMLEVKRPGVSKGDGVRVLMEQAPFAGRMPVFIGDDVTDESVFADPAGSGGIGFSVGRHFAGLAGIFDSPSTFAAPCSSWRRAGGCAS